MADSHTKPPGKPGGEDKEPDRPSVDVDGLRRRARWGVAALVVRTVALQIIVFGGGIILARLLDPRDFGVFAIVQFALAFFSFFGEVGLGAALIQKDSEPSPRELSSVFFFQICVALTVVGVVAVAADGISLLWQDLPEGTAWLLRALSMCLMITCLRVGPSILMERNLQFGRLASIEVTESVSFYIMAVTLALLGNGIWSLVGGSLTQAAAGMLLAFVLRPWRPILAFDFRLLGPIIRFGVPFQLKTIVGFINSAVTPLYGGAVLGARAVGFITWAQSTAYFPLKLVEAMARVSFPLFSRLQGEGKLLAQSLERSIKVCGIFTMFAVGLVMGLGPNIITVIYTDKWMPALPLLYIYAGSIAIGFLSPLVASALDATGRPKIFMYLALCWTVINWIAVPLGTWQWGMVGFAGGYAVHVVLGNILVIVLLARLIPGVRPWRRAYAGIVGGVAIGLLGRYVISPHANSGIVLVGGILLELALFCGIVLVLDRSVIGEIRSMLKKKEPTDDES